MDLKKYIDELKRRNVIKSGVAYLIVAWLIAQVASIAKKLNNPLGVHEWMRTDPSMPDEWIMPILTAPFDEGVSGAASSTRVDEKEND